MSTDVLAVGTFCATDSRAPVTKDCIVCPVGITGQSIVEAVEHESSDAADAGE